MHITKPQELLDKIHQTGIFEENWHQYPTNEARLNKIRLYRQQFRQIYRQLKHYEEKVQIRYGNAHLAPYHLIRVMLQEISAWLKMIESGDLDVYLSYGTAIFGDVDSGWKIGDEATALKWQIKQTEATLKKALADLNTQLNKQKATLQSHHHTVLFEIVLIPVCLSLTLIFMQSDNHAIRLLPFVFIYVIVLDIANYENKKAMTKKEIHKLQKLKQQTEKQMVKLNQYFQE